MLIAEHNSIRVHDAGWHVEYRAIAVVCKGQCSATSTIDTGCGSWVRCTSWSSLFQPAGAAASFRSQAGQGWVVRSCNVDVLPAGCVWGTAAWGACMIHGVQSYGVHVWHMGCRLVVGMGYIIVVQGTCTLHGVQASHTESRGITWVTKGAQNGHHMNHRGCDLAPMYIWTTEAAIWPRCGPLMAQKGA